MKTFWWAVALLALPGVSAAQPPACEVAGQAVHEHAFVTIGGLRQWVTIDGRDCANPVVLMVHGGPGNPNTPFADALYGGWTGEFTVVQWDQRGAGKTFIENPDAREAPLDLHTMASDGVELAQYLTQRLGQDKLILMGSSWGSALAVHMAQRQPELFGAYLGSSQLVDYSDNVATSYARVLGLAMAAGDADVVGQLETLGPPPWTNPRGFGILRRAARKYESLVVDAAPPAWWRPAPGYDTPEYEAGYEAAEDHSFLQFVGLAGDGMGPKLDLRALGHTFAMPVYLVQGEQDLLTTPDVSRAYFDSLVAPRKEFIPVPRAGHDPNEAMLEAQLEALRRAVRGRAQSSGGAMRPASSS